MAIGTTKESSGKKIYFLTPVFGESKKNPNLPSPNIAVRSKNEAGDWETGYVIPEGGKGNPKVDGTIVNAGIRDNMSYEDREAWLKAGSPSLEDPEVRAQYMNERQAFVELYDAANNETYQLNVSAWDVAKEASFRHGVALLSCIDQFVQRVTEGPEDGRLHPETPIQFSIFKNKDYVNTSVMLPKAYDEQGVPVFEPSKERSLLPPEGARAPVPPVVMKPNGEPLKANGRDVRDHSEVIAYAEGLAARINAYFADHESHVEEETINMGEAIDAAVEEDEPSRPRQTA